MEIDYKKLLVKQEYGIPVKDYENLPMNIFEYLKLINEKGYKLNYGIGNYPVSVGNFTETDFVITDKWTEVLLKVPMSVYQLFLRSL